MPKISDQKRAARRDQILDAAWSCFQRQGLHATTMDDIIRASGLSAGAVYGYFASKEDLILAAVTTSLSNLQVMLTSVLACVADKPPARAVEDIVSRIDAFTSRKGFDLKRIALLGWSEAQRNPKLRTTMQAFYLTFRNELKKLAENWRDSGQISASANLNDVAKATLAIVLGFVVEAAIIGDVEATSIGDGLRAFSIEPLRPDKDSSAAKTSSFNLAERKSRKR
jgi:AcrR family transcriptional regulator